MMTNERFEAGEPTRCTCECHGNPQIRHVMPCCATCEICGGRFSAGLRAHRQQCTGKR